MQDPYEASFPSMPRSALEYVEPDYKVRSIEIPELLAQLTREAGQQNLDVEGDIQEDVNRMAKEVQIASGMNLPERNILEPGALSPFSCPECRGALLRITEAGAATTDR